MLRLVTVESIVERALRTSNTLQKVNFATLLVAVVVYVGLLTVAVVNIVFPLAIFASCVMLAEVLVFHIVRTLLVHLALVRSLATDS